MLRANHMLIAKLERVRGGGNGVLGFENAGDVG